MKTCCFFLLRGGGDEEVPFSVEAHTPPPSTLCGSSGSSSRLGGVKRKPVNDQECEDQDFLAHIVSVVVFGWIGRQQRKSRILAEFALARRSLARTAHQAFV